MPLMLDENEQVTIPPEGKRALCVDPADGLTKQLLSDGTSETLGGASTVTADGVSIDGVGSVGDPLAVIPNYIKALSGWTRIDQSITGQNMDITLTGETEYAIEVMGLSVNANAGASAVTIQPNAVATNQAFQGLRSGSDDVPFGEHAANLQCAFASASGSATFRFTMFLKTGAVRFYHGSYTSLNSSNAITNHGSLSGVWNETATAITSIRIRSDRADGMAAGSFLLWRAIRLAA